MKDIQTHTVNILFEGNFYDLIHRLVSQGLEVEFYPSGLQGSAHTIKITKPEPKEEQEPQSGAW